MRDGTSGLRRRRGSAGEFRTTPRRPITNQDANAARIMQPDTATRELPAHTGQRRASARRGSQRHGCHRYFGGHRRQRRAYGPGEDRNQEAHSPRPRPARRDIHRRRSSTEHPAPDRARMRPGRCGRWAHCGCGCPGTTRHSRACHGSESAVTWENGAPSGTLRHGAACPHATCNRGVRGSSPLAGSKATGAQALSPIGSARQDLISRFSSLLVTVRGFP